MPVFNRGEQVKIVESEEGSDKTYIIKEMKKSRKGGDIISVKIT
jgi:hypothetical protein